MIYGVLYECGKGNYSIAQAQVALHQEKMDIASRHGCNDSNFDPGGIASGQIGCSVSFRIGFDSVPLEEHMESKRNWRNRH